MKIRNTLLLAGSLLLLGACDESKYDLDSLVPEQYHKILYVNNSGKQEVTLYDTGESYAYTFSIFKSALACFLVVPPEASQVSKQILWKFEAELLL